MKERKEGKHRCERGGGGGGETDAGGRRRRIQNKLKDGGMKYVEGETGGG